MRLHPVAWIAWLGAVAATATLVSNPFYLLVALGAITLVALSAPPDPSPLGHAFGSFVVLGVGLLILRLLFASLVTHIDGTRLFTLPALELPRWTGGVEIGGPVTAEVLMDGLVAGLRLLVVISALGVFNARADLTEVVRLVPAPLRDVGLVVQIAIGFVPGLLRTVSDVRDAQRLRGERGRALALSLVVPVLGQSLERALLLAESMEARGYGRAESRVPRTVVVAGLIGVLGGLVVWMAGGRWIATGAVLAGGMLLVLALRHAHRNATVTRLAPPRWTPADTVTTAVSVLAVGAAVALPVSYTPFPSVAMPAFDAAAVALVLLAAPVPAALRAPLRPLRGAA